MLLLTCVFPKPKSLKRWILSSEEIGNSYAARSHWLQHICFHSLPAHRVYENHPCLCEPALRCLLSISNKSTIVRRPPSSHPRIALCQGLGISEFFRFGDVIVKIFPLDAECALQKRRAAKPLLVCITCFRSGMRRTITALLREKLYTPVGKQDALAPVNFLTGLGFQISLRNTNASAVSLTD